VGHRSADDHPAILGANRIQVLDRRDIHQRRNGCMVALLHVEDQVGAAGDKERILTVADTQRQRIGDRLWGKILFPEGHLGVILLGCGMCRQRTWASLSIAQWIWKDNVVQKRRV